MPSRPGIVGNLSHIQDHESVLADIQGGLQNTTASKDRGSTPGSKPMPANVVDLFVFLAADTSNFHTHPVLLMTMDFLQRREDWHYGVRRSPVAPSPGHPLLVKDAVGTEPLARESTSGLATADQVIGEDGASSGALNTRAVSRGVPVRNFFFPQILRGQRKSPPSLDTDGLSGTHPWLVEGGVGLTIKAIHNYAPSLQGSINISKANTAISKLNKYFDSMCTQLLAHLYRFEFRLAPSPELVARYTTLLLLPTWREGRMKLYRAGGWKDPVHEMFSHFVKLMACGASDSQIFTVWDSLVNPGDEFAALPLSVFGQMTKQSWKTWRGWLHSGVIDFTDIQLSASAASAVFRSMAYIRHYRYDKKRKGGSCFHGMTPVLMADGTVMPIRDICVGDAVATRAFYSAYEGDDACSATARDAQTACVVFVSQPPRAGRTLYELDSAPGVLFTDTHPLIARQGSRTWLRFVDRDEALNANPTWESLPCKAIRVPEACPDSQGKHDPLREYVAPQRITGAGEDDETLFDLILEPDLGLPEAEVPRGPQSYFLLSQNGHIIEAASEAPVQQWFPFAMAFFDGVMQRVQTGGEPLLRLLQSHACAKNNGANCHLLHLHEAAPRAWDILRSLRGKSGQSSLSVRQSVQSCSLAVLLSRAGDENGALAAQVLELLIALLGRHINNLVFIPWLQEASRGEGRCKFLVIHTMTLASETSVVPLAHSSGSTQLHIVVRNGDRVVASEMVSSRREGLLTYDIQCAIELHQEEGAYPVISDVDSGDAALLTIEIRHRPRTDGEDTAFAGRGVFQYGVMTILQLGGNSPLDPDDDGVLTVQYIGLRRDVVHEWQNKRPDIIDRDRVDFAEQLGLSFLDRLQESLVPM